jgi:hypothetical protein
VTDAAITAQIHNQRQQQNNKKKYGHRKAKATRGLVNASLFPQVLYRPLSVYEQISKGGGVWTS